MAERKPFGTDKYAAAMAASLLVILGGMMTTVVLAVAGGADPVLSVLAAVGTFAAISLIPLRAMRPGRAPQFDRAPKEGLFSALRKFFERDERESQPLRPWKRKKSGFVPQPHGNCFVPEREEKRE